MGADKKKSKTIRVRNYLPYVGSFVIFLGVTRLIIFYTAFGVSIIDFLDFSEILTSFLDIIALSVVLICFSTIQSILMADKEELKTTQITFDKVLNENNIFKRLWLYLKLFHLYLLGGLMCTLIFYVWHFFNKDITTATILWTVGFFSGTFILLVLRIEITRKHEQFKSSFAKRQFSGMVFLILLFVGVIYSIAKSQINSIRDDKSTLGTTITLDNDDLLISDSLNYYIGKTQNYVFIHHESNKTTEVIPISRVKRLLIKKKKVDSFKFYD